MIGPRAVIRRLRTYLRKPPTPAEERKAIGWFRDNLYFPELRLGFVTVPKAANTSLKYAILESLPESARQPLLARITEAGTRQGIHRALRASAYRCGRERLLEPDVDHVLATVRHPEARLKSFYVDKVLGDGWPERLRVKVARLYGIDAQTSFEAFVARLADIPDDECELHFRSQAEIIGADLLGDPRLCILRTECLAGDFRAAMFRTGLGLGTPRMENAKAGAEVSVSSRGRALIERRFAQDYALFYRAGEITALAG